MQSASRQPRVCFQRSYAPGLSYGKVLSKPAHSLLQQVQSPKLITQLHACDDFHQLGYPGRITLLQRAKGFFLSPFWVPDSVAQSQKVTVHGETCAKWLLHVCGRDTERDKISPWWAQLCGGNETPVLACCEARSADQDKANHSLWWGDVCRVQ